MKILYSPGFGAGWSSWCSGDREQQKFMLSYLPLIGAIENGMDIGFDESRPYADQQPYRPGSVLEQFAIDFKKRFDERPYLGGARDLDVTEVTEPFRIHEYDGSESVEIRDRIGWFDPDTDFIDPDEEDFE
jgi:hypothetical protein